MAQVVEGFAVREELIRMYTSPLLIAVCCLR